MIYTECLFDGTAAFYDVNTVVYLAQRLNSSWNMSTFLFSYFTKMSVFPKYIHIKDR